MTNRDFRFVCCGLLLGMAVTATVFRAGTVKAQQPPTEGLKRCDYTYIDDAGEPNIGKRGEIKYDGPWKAVVDGGWVLRSANTVGSTGVYVFEKCR